MALNFKVYLLKDSPVQGGFLLRNSTKGTSVSVKEGSNSPLLAPDSKYHQYSSVAENARVRTYRLTYVFQHVIFSASFHIGEPNYKRVITIAEWNIDFIMFIY